MKSYVQKGGQSRVGLGPTTAGPPPGAPHRRCAGRPEGCTGALRLGCRLAARCLNRGAVAALRAGRRPGAVVRRAPAPGEPAPAAGRGRGPGTGPLDPARHHRGRDPLRRRRGDGRRPAGHRRATRSPAAGSTRCSRPTTTPASRSPARRARRWRWSSCSRPSSSTTRRCRARCSASRARPTSSACSCAATCPPRCRASRSCRCSPGTTSTARSGRVFSYDVTGGRYEETDYQGQGSGSVHARNWIKAGWREGMSLDDTVDLAIRALFAAADEDAATGGPDLVRGIFPTRRRDRRPRLPRWSRTTTIARRADALLGGREERSGAMNMPFYVSPEQVMKDRADYARKGIARGRSLVACESAADGIIWSPTTAPARCPRSARSTTAIAFAGGRQVQRVPDAARRRRPPRRPQGLLVLPRGRERPRSWRTRTRRPSARSSPTR